MIKKPEEQSYENENFCMIICGTPGVGKTTLAASAPNPVLFDCDKGMKRVRPEHRCDTSSSSKYEDFLADIASIGDSYKTVIVDTGGALIEMLKDWATRTEPSASKKNGGFALAGYGIVKTEFLRLSADLRRKYNVIFLFHAQKEKTDDDYFYDLVVEGATKTIVWQPCDLGAFMFIQDGKRYLGFTPTERYNAKSSFGIKGLYEVPELVGEKNDFLTQLFEQARKNIADEAKAFTTQSEAYDKAMKEGEEIIGNVKTVDDINLCLDALKNIEHSLSSEPELKAKLKAKMAELKIVYNKETKKYEQN